jgi:hypothetical protein
MSDEPDKKWWERRFREQPPDLAFVGVALAAIIVAVAIQQIFLPDTPRYILVFIVLGVLCAYSVYRLVTFRD